MGPSQAHCTVDNHVNSHPYSCAVHDLCNCAWQLQESGDLVPSSQQTLLDFFLSIPSLRSHKKSEQLITVHVIEDLPFQRGGYNQKLKVPLTPLLKQGSQSSYKNNLSLLFLFLRFLQIFIVMQSSELLRGWVWSLRGKGQGVHRWLH